MKIRFGRKSYETCRILSWNFLTRQILKQSFHNASEIDFRNLQRVRYWNAKKQRVKFWIEKFTTSQIFKKFIFLKKKISEKKTF